MIRWQQTFIDEDFDLLEAHRLQREALKRSILEEVGPLCEACDVRAGWDLHEVYVPRSAVPKGKQEEIFVRGNCALVCRMCHDSGAASTDKFKQRFAARLKILGHEPYVRAGRLWLER